MARRKISVIGAGFVGSTTAQRLAEMELGDVVLVDIVADMPQGKALDIEEAGPVLGYDTRVIGANGYEDTEGSDVVVITSGVPRKQGMSRDDLLKTNMKIVKSVVDAVIVGSPNSILLMVANPLDAMCYVAHKVSKFPRERVVGMAGVLDSARFRTFVAMELGVSVENVTAFVLGGHGDDMVPSTRFTTVAGVPVEELLPKDRLDQIVQRTRDGGAEIVKLLKTGSAYYAPSAAVAQMVEAIVKDKKLIVPCCVRTEGEYGLPKGSWVGLPAKLGSKGVEQIVEFKLSDGEKKALGTSAAHVAELCEACDRLE
jgi:malate dehydrogenase